MVPNWPLKWVRGAEAHTGAAPATLMRLMSDPLGQFGQLPAEEV
jgi:hypothetical protein